MKNYFASITFILFLLFLVDIKVCSAQSDSTEIKLNYYKQLFIDGTITSQEYETLRKQILGITEIKPAQQVNQSIVNNITTDSAEIAKMYEQGKKDAYLYFKTGGVFGGTFAATLFASPIIGLIPAIACSSSTPKEENFLNKNPQLFKTSDYIRGYRTEAKRQKKHAAWAAWGAGFGLSTAAGIITGIVVSQKQKR